MKLKDKVAIVTGAAQGIGREIALSLAKEGARVVVADVDEEKAKIVAKEIEVLGSASLPCKLDVSLKMQVEEMVSNVVGKFSRIDILVNNAGIVRDAFLIKMKEEDWDKVLEINLKGSFNCLQAVSRIMLKQRDGKIINIASIIGIIGNVGQANYAASKAGIIALTKTASRELASRGINVNAIAPGFIQTSMTASLEEKIKEKIMSRIPAGKFGLPADVANLVLFLASDEANYIHGEVIRVDGGMAM